jgi:micrococcal nuclease
VAVWLAAGLAACGPSPTASTAVAVEAERGLAVVVRVIDGDTIDVTLGSYRERVRLIGVDTPETVSTQTPEQCFGAEASSALASLLPVGTEVRLERDHESRDRYGRLLAYVHRRHDDVFVNAWLLESGLGDVLFYEPNTSFERAFVALRDEARRNGVGLWTMCSGPDQPLGSFPPDVTRAAPSDGPPKR